MAIKPRSHSRAPITRSVADDLLRQLEADFNVGPVQERLAALRIALDRVAGSPEPLRLREALIAVDKVLELAPQNPALLSLRQQLIDAQLWALVDQGIATWSGGKPPLHKRVAKITPGPPLSDWIIENRR
jgi:hypothetical protein